MKTCSLGNLLVRCRTSCYIKAARNSLNQRKRNGFIHFPAWLLWGSSGFSTTSQCGTIRLFMPLCKTQLTNHIQCFLFPPFLFYVCFFFQSFWTLPFQFFSVLQLFFLRKKRLPDSFSLHGSVMRHSLLKGISAQIVSAAVSILFSSPSVITCNGIMK